MDIEEIKKEFDNAIRGKDEFYLDKELEENIYSNKKNIKKAYKVLGIKSNQDAK